MNKEQKQARVQRAEYIVNIPILDVQKKHTLMVFRLQRKGYKVKAISSTKGIKSCTESITR